MRDEEIDFSDIPEQGKAFFKNAILRLPARKATVTIRLDHDVLNWFKTQGRGYQTRINALLRAYMECKKLEGIWITFLLILPQCRKPMVQPNPWR